MDIAANLRDISNRRKEISATLNACTRIAYSVGELADKGMTHSTSKLSASKMIGAIQTGEYLVTGSIPEQNTVRSLITIIDEEVTQ